MTTSTIAPTLPTTAEIYPIFTADDHTMAGVLKDPEAAIYWGLGALEPFELHDFLSDWEEGKDLSPWVIAWRENQQAA